MKQPLLLLVAGSCCVVLAASGHLRASRVQAQHSDAVPSTSSQYRVVLDRYCVTCHNERLGTAGLALDTLDVERISDAAEVWEKVAGKLRAGAMPPVGMPRPDKALSDALASWLESALDRAAAANPNPGASTIHRLNRAEYANAIRDLVGLDINVQELLPTDDASEGFDNIADSLSMSPTLTTRYLSAAAKISRLAIGNRAMSPTTETHYVRPDLVQEDPVSEDLPFGSRGGVAVRHVFPADAEYEIRIRLQRIQSEDIRGLGEAHDLEVRLDGVKVRSFTVGGQEKNWTADTDYALTGDAGLHFRLPVKAGARVIVATFYKKYSTLAEGLMEPSQRNAVTYNDTRLIQPGVATVSVTGPYDATAAGDTPSRRRIFVCRPASAANDTRCARTIVSTLAQRAYRRPVTDADLRPLLALYGESRNRRGFEAGIETALRGILVSPEFLFRVERERPDSTPGSAHDVTDMELASRLSFFLWSSIPDDELLRTATRRRLRVPGVLEQQARRMLADARSQSLVTNFAGQWLQLRNVSGWVPDLAAAPTFDGNLRQAFLRETELFFESIVREDRSVLDLLNANYTFLNERLARHYGIPDVYGVHFRRVTLPDERRRGLLGQGSILMVTSYPNRTSPVLRGKFILENILGTPPPPPPPNVPELKEGTGDGKILPMRQRMELHRANPACAVCHARMDPLGFAFENFDVVGGWRATDESGTTIDASGTLPDGTTFRGPVELRKALAGHHEEFVGTLTRKLLTYALGRGVEYFDAPGVRTIKRQAARDDYRFSSLIVGIVKSTAFRMRRTGDPETRLAAVPLAPVR